jgi:hypothetical protein
MGSPRCGTTRTGNGLTSSIYRLRRWITICPPTLHTVQPVVGSDRDFDVSDSHYALDDMITISYYILRSVIELSVPMSAALYNAVFQGRRNTLNVFENCNTLRNSAAGTTGIHECLALYALGKLFHFYFYFYFYFFFAILRQPL